MTQSVHSDQRHSHDHRCPICGGRDEDPRGSGRRCNGYTSSDGEWVRCSRDEHAGRLDADDYGLFVHRMYGACKCGTQHGPARERSGGASSRQIDATYDYKDESGRVLFQVVRFSGKQFRQRRHDPSAESGWSWKLGDARRVLYRLPDLIAALKERTADPVYIVEGEKDVDALWKRGLVATCNPHGAGKWKVIAKQAAAELAGRDVIVIADADEPGRKHARAVAGSLAKAARSVAVLELTPHKDVGDWLAAGGDVAELPALAEAAPDANAPPRTWTTSTGSVLRDATRETASAGESFDRGDHVELGERMLERLRGDGPELVHAEGELYRYGVGTGLWTPVDEGEQSREVQSFAGSWVGKRTLKIKLGDVSGSMKLAHHRVADRDFFATAPAGIAFTASYVQVLPSGEIEQREHSPEHRARFAYPFGYRATPQPARLLAFLGEVFRDDDDKEQKIALVQEYVGLCVLGRAASYQRAVIGLGVGANGKGVLTKIVAACMPPKSVCAIAPHQMSNEYRRAKLAGALINIVSELPPADIEDSNAWKAIVAGDLTDARHIRCEPFDFRPVAGHLYSANPPLPGTSDQSDGFWRRPLMLTFNRVFERDEQVPDLEESIIAAELPDDVSWFIAGGARALAARQLTIPPSHHEALDRWRHAADQVRAFVRARTAAIEASEPASNGTTGTELFASYREWATETHHRNLYSGNRFGERARALIANAEVHGVRYYRVRLLSGWERQNADV